MRRESFESQHAGVLGTLQRCGFGNAGIDCQEGENAEWKFTVHWPDGSTSSGADYDFDHAEQLANGGDRTLQEQMQLDSFTPA